jgi:outer membrane receptor for ferrienterochelin and colicins
MKKLILLLFLLLPCVGFAQNSFRTVVRDNESKQPVEGAIVKIKGGNTGVITNAEGFAELTGIPSGQQVVEITMVGYEIHEQAFSFPLSEGQMPVTIELYHTEHETEEITVSTTRISRSIDDVTTRIEVISKEEVEEKSLMEPANVILLLHESTGINTQTTSPVSGSTNIQIQGLDGRYSQILKDGFPLYEGLSEGLSLLQLPPLDLQQVEIIKGPSSTLYGNGAISGVINFITREPTAKPSFDFLINGESFGGLDLGGFYSSREGNMGFTFLGTATFKSAYDADDDDFTDIPETRSFTLFPKMYLYPDNKTKMIFGFNASYDDRMGGDVTLINSSADTIHTYFEKNVSNRYNGIFKLERAFDNTSNLLVKASGTSYKRSIETSDYRFEGQQYSGYSEVSYYKQFKKLILIGGADFQLDDFKETKILSDTLRDYDKYYVGTFVQSIYDFSRVFSLETGLRYNYEKDYGSFILPKVSALFRFNENISSRLGGGLGYKTPTIFTGDAENLAFRNVLPLGNDLEAEKSIGGSLDINIITSLFKPTVLTINQMFFYTRIDNPLELTQTPDTHYVFRNGSGHIESRGFETNVRFIYDPFKLFLGYTFTDAVSIDNGNESSLPLVPKHKLGIVLLYEQHGAVKLGLETYYTGRQNFSDGAAAPDFWEAGFFAQKYFGDKFSVFVNFENFTNTKQSNYSPVVIPPHNNPSFSELFTHNEGFYFNGGIKITL